ncbi:unnamed protein product, partial [Darwinula stevensoni]
MSAPLRTFGLGARNLLRSTIGLWEGSLENQLLLPAGSGRWMEIGKRYRHSLPINTILMFVPQQEAWVVERMGKYHRILEPGLNILLPIMDRVRYVQSLKELAIDVPQQSAITSELGKIPLDYVFRERESLNIGIVEAINKASEAWGIACLRYEIRDIKLPSRVQEAMQMQVEAERKKRAAILESEGTKEAEINVAEGRKQARILASEAEKQEQINQALGEASAIYAKAEARARALHVVAKSLAEEHGSNAASLNIAEQYVHAFQKLAKASNTLIIPGNTGDVSGIVAQ